MDLWAKHQASTDLGERDRLIKAIQRILIGEYQATTWAPLTSLDRGRLDGVHAFSNLRAGSIRPRRREPRPEARRLAYANDCRESR
jgi:hypothetical protein